jgi:membrane-associated phospholipid phosphatase
MNPAKPGREAAEFLAAAWRNRPRRPLRWLGAVALLAALALIASRFDHRLAALAPGAGGPLAPLAGEFSFWGDFLPGTLPLSLLLIGAGTLFRRPAWRRAGLAALLAAIVAGGCVSAFRVTLGRPRPFATAAEVAGKIGHVPAPLLTFGKPGAEGELPDGFYGPQKPMLFHGFPSGHAATSLATGAALTVALPPLGVPVLLGAVGVCWSRFYLRRHYLSDLAVGGTVGIAVGIYCGLLARRQKITS